MMNVVTDLMVDGKTVTIGINAQIKAKGECGEYGTFIFGQGPGKGV
jgi:hypothetical protein